MDIKKSIKEYYDSIDKTITLKEKIEKEIKEINILFEKTMNEISESYLKKHEKLTIEEHNMKTKLENEVTRTKEKLEKFLTETNETIKKNNRFKGGCKNIENEENNIIKTLSFISKINKNQKYIKSLFQTLMRNIKFFFVEEENKVKYDEYYFNGLSTPKNINFQENSNNLNISWEKEILNIINIDNNKIKFKVEMKKENEKFIEIYDGKKLQYK